MAFSPAGLFPAGPVLASGSDDAEVGLVAEAVACKGAKHTDSVTAIAWHPTQRRFASVGLDRKVELWNVKHEGESILCE